MLLQRDDDAEAVVAVAPEPGVSHLLQGGPKRGRKGFGPFGTEVPSGVGQFTPGIVDQY